MLDALPDGGRALWATALYAGLRRGELRGLRGEVEIAHDEQGAVFVLDYDFA